MTAESSSTAFRACETFRGIVHPEFQNRLSAETLVAAVRRMEAPGAAVLQSGRNLTVRMSLPMGAREALDVVVKRFGRQSAWKDALSRRFGTKAFRSYCAATHLQGRGIGTPAPVAVLERWEGRRLRESYAITRYVPDLRSFRRELVELYEHQGPCEALMALLERVAAAVSDMHDAGFLHRDLGNQNLLLAPPDTATGDRRVLVIDLNRGCCRPRPLSLRERARDLSRLHLPSDLLRVFKEMYWRGDVPPEEFLRLERRYRRRYAWHAATRRLRHPLRRRAGQSPDGEYPADRDLWIWDERSVQAISAFRSRDRHRLRPPGRVRRTLTAVLLGAWPVWRAYRTLRPRAFQREVLGIGERAAIALTARSETFARERALLRELGARNVLVRLCHHEDAERRSFTLDAMRRLNDEGYGVALALVQDRRAVLNPGAWENFGREALRAVAPFVRWVEVGHAVNRVKWGVWSYTELAALHAPVAAWARDFPGVRFSAPAIIDFEPDFLLAALRSLPKGVPYATLSQHLYVDRRGAPESRQGPFDAVDKLALLRAAGQASGRCGKGLIVSEFNWPLLGTGVWSPVGSPYESPGVRTNDPSVDERQAALYTVRYLLLGLCSGLADEMVYWRLVARGFGLVDDSNPAAWRRRPAFEALRTWHKQLNGTAYVSSREQAGCTCLQFRRSDGAPLHVFWRTSSDVSPVSGLPWEKPPKRTIDTFGRELRDEALNTALAEGSVVYALDMSQPSIQR